MVEPLEAYRRFDRAHATPPDARARIEARMMAALAEQPAPADGGQVDELELVAVDPTTDTRPRMRPRPIGWLAAAAALLLIVGVWVQQQDEPIAEVADDTARVAELVAGYCAADVEPVAGAFDRLRVNPTTAMAEQVVDAAISATDALEVLAPRLSRPLQDRVEYAVGSLRDNLADVREPAALDASAARGVAAQLGAALSGLPGSDACPLERLTTPDNPIADFYDGYSGD